MRRGEGNGSAKGLTCRRRPWGMKAVQRKAVEDEGCAEEGCGE